MMVLLYAEKMMYQTTMFKPMVNRIQQLTNLSTRPVANNPATGHYSKNHGNTTFFPANDSDKAGSQKWNCRKS